VKPSLETTRFRQRTSVEIRSGASDGKRFEHGTAADPALDFRMWPGYNKPTSRIAAPVNAGGVCGKWSTSGSRHISRLSRHSKDPSSPS